MSEIERNYLYVRACFACLFSVALAPALALGAFMGMCVLTRGVRRRLDDDRDGTTADTGMPLMAN